ncbi:MAG: hypothetical protein P4L46_24865 [Fimbriimonas sp.]|nr:hypothetical protein [Fimbriimonas sp.]
MKRLAIIVHPTDHYDCRYVLHRISDIWLRRRIAISIVTSEADYVPSDLGIMHVDLTRVPDELLALASRFPLTLNGKLDDSSKRHISRNLICRPSDFDGPVIVKSNLNAGGWREAQLVNDRVAAGRGASASNDYRVFECACDVPAAVWEGTDYVVERFLPERQGEFFCLRTWMFLGTSETNSRSLSREPVVKLSNIIGREVISEVPDEIRAMRAQFGFDFGKFDYAISDGRPVLYDVNRTPMVGGGPTSRALQGMIEVLSTGIDGFLEHPL